MDRRLVGGGRLRLGGGGTGPVAAVGLGRWWRGWVGGGGGTGLGCGQAAELGLCGALREVGRLGVLVGVPAEGEIHSGPGRGAGTDGSGSPQRGSRRDGRRHERSAQSRLSPGFPRTGYPTLSCGFSRVRDLSTGNTRGFPQVMPRSTHGIQNIDANRRLFSREIHSDLSTSERSSYVPTLSTLIHRHPQPVSPAGGYLPTQLSTDVHQPWGNRCGQTRRVILDLTACGHLWIAC